MKLTIVFFAVLATLASAVSGAPVPELLKTNAARFASGWPPLYPKSIRRNPTPVQGICSIENLLRFFFH